MPKAYETDIDEGIVQFCLNCKKEKCNGNCDDLKAEKRRIKREREKTNESNNKHGQTE